MRTQWTTKGKWDAGSSCSCDQGLHWYLRNFGEGGCLNPPKPHPSACHCHGYDKTVFFGPVK